MFLLKKLLRLLKVQMTIMRSTDLTERYAYGMNKDLMGLQIKFIIFDKQNSNITYNTIGKLYK